MLQRPAASSKLPRGRVTHQPARVATYSALENAAQRAKTALNRVPPRFVTI